MHKSSSICMNSSPKRTSKWCWKPITKTKSSIQPNQKNLLNHKTTEESVKCVINNNNKKNNSNDACDLARRHHDKAAVYVSHQEELQILTQLQVFVLNEL